MAPEVLERARRVTTLILDVDGVLTDGRIIYDECGDELKCFDVQDGAGLMLWSLAGLRSAVITARHGRAIKRRAKELRVDALVQRAAQKLPAYEQLLTRWRLSPEQVCAMGDDVMELPILKRVGLAVAVSNAVDEVKAASHYITQRPGGRGAVREAVELVLKASGRWVDLLKRYQG